MPSHVWVVRDMMHFENVAVTKPAPASQPASVQGPRRYLACADCDMGPIGLVAADGQHLVYADRVAYLFPPPPAV